MKRRAFLLAPLALAGVRGDAQVSYPSVTSENTLVFPRDHGSHPAFRTEWWYLTAWVHDESGAQRGLQVTFFRNRPGIAEGGASSFAPRQLLFAHAAIADPVRGRLRHDQRAARAGFGLAEAVEPTTDVRIGDWSLRLDAGVYLARIVAREFTLDVTFTAKAPPMLQGAGGMSHKGPRAHQASYYYSRPHLAVAGTLALDGRTLNVRGEGWLDHEWSSDYLAPEARGWDWTGLNFDDGSALMAFRIRDASGNAYWTGGAVRDAAGAVRDLPPSSIQFTPRRQWRSTRTGIEYPVSFDLQAGDVQVTLEPLMDDQELDSRASVGTIYWEGAVRALAGSQETGRGGEGAVRALYGHRELGRGYLELTGYGGALKL